MKVYCSDEKWKTILTGEKKYKFENFGFSMMIGRLTRKLKKNSASLDTCIKEANSFCNKYEAIMQEDLAQLNAN